MTANKSLKIAVAGVFTALIFLCTYFLQIPAFTGYINLGDGMVLLSAVWLGFPAIAPAAVGSALSDLFSPFPIYAPATLIIKGAMAVVTVLILRAAGDRKIARVPAFLLAEAVMVGGYFLFDRLIYGFAAAVINLGGNGIQALFGFVAGLLLSMLPNPLRQNTSSH